jgi:hypothetical protein
MKTRRDRLPGERVRPSQLLPLLLGLMAMIIVVRAGIRRFEPEGAPVAGAHAGALAGAPCLAGGAQPAGPEGPEQRPPAAPSRGLPARVPEGLELSHLRGPASSGPTFSPAGFLALHRALPCLISPVVQERRAARPRPPPDLRFPAPLSRAQENPSSPRPPPAAA